MVFWNKLSSFKRSSCAPSIQQFNAIKKSLLGKKWSMDDEYISPDKAKQLFITLESALNRKSVNQNRIKRYLTDRLVRGSTLPYGYSLVYCNPMHLESDLDMDGYDNYNAPVLGNMDFFQRRMWVGGEFLYNPNVPLRFGDNIHFEETVDRVKGFDHNNTIFVQYNRKFWNAKGLCLTEKRKICYLSRIYENNLGKKLNNQPSGQSQIVIPSEITNFRMSALTFNSHLLHYNPDYCRQVEKYPKVVVEAPLLLDLALQYWMDNTQFENKLIKFNYKVSHPFFVGEPATISYETVSDQSIRLLIHNTAGYEGFSATLTART